MARLRVGLVAVCALVALVTTTAAQDGAVTLPLPSQSPHRTGAATWYVAPVSGSDAWTGTLPAPNTAGTDGPFKTIAVALAASRKAAAVTVTIYLRAHEGAFNVGSVVSLNGDDRGLLMATYPPDAEAGLKASISGGAVLGGTWVPPASANASAWQLKLDASSRFQFHQLFVANAGSSTSSTSRAPIDAGSALQRLTRARSPNEGSHYKMMETSGSSSDAFTYAPGHPHLDALASGAVPLPAVGSNAVEAIVYASWQAARRAIVNVTGGAARVISVNARAPILIEPRANSGSRFYVENFLEALDAPGEWYADSGNALLHYMPQTQDEDPRNMTFVAPRIVGDVLRLDGATGVTVSNISVRLSDWNAQRTLTQSGLVQAASWTDASAVHVTGSSRDVTLDRIEVGHCGDYGLWVEGNSSDITIRGAFVHDLGGGGVRIGRGKPLTPEPPGAATRGVIGVDSTVVRGSNVHREGNGILLQHASHNQLLYNEVAFFNHVGVSVGWTWDYSPTGAYNNTISHNMVHHMGNGDLSDLAGIYLLGISPGTIVNHNVIHSSYPFYTYGHGIYTDQATSDVVLTNNIVYDTLAAGVYQHFGRNNTFTNNIVAFADGGNGELWHAALGNWGESDYTFTHNIVYVSSATGPMFETPFHGNVSFASNTYWNASAPTVAALSSTFPDSPAGSDMGCHSSFSQWQAAGYDRSSIVEDPMFVDAVNRNFSVPATSPAVVKTGFIPFDVDDNGPRAPYRVTWRPQCGPCADPGVPAHGGRHGADFECGSSLVFHCDDGFENGGSTVRTCGPRGAWSGLPAVCIAVPFIEMGGALSSGQYVVSPATTAFAITQGDGNFCVYTGSGPTNVTGTAWCAIDYALVRSSQPSSGPYTAMLQTDGNFCVRGIDGTQVWCSGSGGGSYSNYFAVVQDDARWCVYEGGSPSDNRGQVWCSPLW